FMFDEDIAGDPVEDQFQIVAEDGTKTLAAAGTCDIDNDSDVTCDYPAIEDAGDNEIVVAGVGDCAVEADADAECNTVGDVPITDSLRAPGLSDAPDLESCDIDEASNLATFFFDEQVDEDSADESAFDVFDVSGNLSSASEVDDSNEEEGEITLEFDEDAVEDAVGCHVDFDAVDDFLTNASPEATVGTAQPAPTTATTTTTPITSDTTSPTPTTRHVQASISISFDRPAFKGTIRSGRAGCERGRRVVLKKKKRGVNPRAGSDTSDRAGNWRIGRRNASGRYFAVAQRKVFTAANGDRIICDPKTSDTRRVR
ncbi:MAG TPA: hypothetical protein VNP73_07225, partial [Actinomycetota bacterium]|nr:hypothetical protein [Actinomycetota bacterium]